MKNYRPGFVVTLIATLCVLGALVFVTPVPQAQAATNATLTLKSTTAGGSCIASSMVITYSYTPTDNDNGGADYTVMVAYDGNGTPIASDFRAITVPTTNDWTTGLDDLQAITARPITVKMHDTGYSNPPVTSDDTIAQANYAAGFPVIAQITFDPGTDPNLSAVCGSLPLIASSDIAPIEEDPEPWFYSPVPSTPDYTAAHQTVTFNGATACGVFEVHWYGVKFILPSNFPDCVEHLPDNVEVACMTSDGQWTTDNVKDAAVSEGTFHATVYQHGTCGIFPK